MGKLGFFAKNITVHHRKNVVHSKPTSDILGTNEIYVHIEGPKRLTVPLGADINIICNAYVNLKVGHLN